MRAFRLGITGGLASGKSTVAGWLREAGFRVLDADRLVAELYEPDEPGARRVEELFGRSFLDARGAVDRERLAAEVFADPDARRRLEAAIHPLVRERAERRWAAAEGEGVVGLEATLLVEAGLVPEFDLVVSVEADPERRLRWAVERGLAEAEARARLAAQGDGATRRAGVHRILRNDGTLEDLRQEVDELVEEVRRLAAASEM